MQLMPRYDDILIEVEGFLRGRVQAALAAGIDRRRIVLDPGYGFGKTPEQTYRLLRQLRDVDSGGYPWLIGLSRKSMRGHVIGREPADRVFGSVARSEERRGGQEGVSTSRSRWLTYDLKKKTLITERNTCNKT